MSDKWLVAWDFPQRPKSTFYELLASEFAPPAVQYIQRSVMLAQDEETARGLRSLCQWYGASVVTFAVNGRVLEDPAQDRAAEEWIAGLIERRLRHRGRKPNGAKGARQG